METKEERYIDKSSWQPGPWMEEPDKVQWTDERTGLPCLIVRGPSGALCGYVGVAEGHPYFGVEYNGCVRKTKCEETYCGHSPDLEAHGGITYSEFCQEGGHICHVPAPGEPDRVWWFGFDCAHSGDLCPQYAARVPRFGFGFDGVGEVYRGLDYVRNYCTDLARQLKDAA